ncbi:MAG: hypothetical protein J6S44_03700 [Clostridia bacterium]|nr:hypothetical protein [Clostridia bacterium]
MKRWQIIVLIVSLLLVTALILACSLLWRSWLTSYQGMMTVLTVLPILGIAAMLILGHYRFRRR